MYVIWVQSPPLHDSPKHYSGVALKETKNNRLKVFDNQLLAVLLTASGSQENMLPVLGALWVDQETRQSLLVWTMSGPEWGPGCLESQWSQPVVVALSVLPLLFL